LFETFLILIRKYQHTMINAHRSSLKAPLFLSYFQETRNFSLSFENPSNMRFLGNSSSGSRVVSVGMETLTDRETDTQT